MLLLHHCYILNDNIWSYYYYYFTHDINFRQNYVDIWRRKREKNQSTWKKNVLHHFWLLHSFNPFPLYNLSLLSKVSSLNITATCACGYNSQLITRSNKVNNELRSCITSKTMGQLGFTLQQWMLLKESEEKVYEEESWQLQWTRKCPEARMFPVTHLL